MKTIWYFVGLLLVIMGAVITSSGVYSLINPPAQPKVLSQLHPDLWWGLVMIVAGLIFLLTNWKKTVE
jgi:divalent metal cation (Fe/Co/Zn/Cd) transporter